MINMKTIFQKEINQKSNSHCFSNYFDNKRLATRQLLSDGLTQDTKTICYIKNKKGLVCVETIIIE